MIKRALLYLFICLSLFSCKGLSPFFSGNKTKALLYCGNDGEMVVFIDVAKNRKLLAKYLNISPSNLSRFRDIIAIISPDCIYGIVEGDIPSVAKKIIVKKLGGKKAKEDGVSFYKLTMGDNTVSFNLIYPGVILFSLGSYKKAHENFVSKRTEKLPNAISLYMQEHDLSMHGINPSNDMMYMFKDSVMKGTMLTIDYDSENNRVILNGIMQLKTQSAFNAMKVNMQNQMLQYSKSGKMSKMEIINGMRSTKFLEKEQAIVYDNYSMPLDMFKAIVTHENESEPAVQSEQENR